MSKDLRFAMLLDCYGEFLTPHQYRMTELYYCADLSLGEIAEMVGITRQGVRDGIKRGEQILLKMEDTLRAGGMPPGIGNGAAGRKAAVKRRLEIQARRRQHGI